MPGLTDLPNELIDQIMDYVDDAAKRLHPFLFSRQLHPSASRAIYRNICLIIVSNEDIANQVHKVEVEKGHSNATFRFYVRHNLLKLALLADAAFQYAHLFQHTQTMEIKLSKEYPTLEARCAFDSTTATLWDEGVATVLAAARHVEHIACDWFGAMPVLSSQIPHHLNLRTLSLRGISDNALLPSNMELPTNLEEFRLDRLSLKARSGVDNNVEPTKNLRLMVTDCRPSVWTEFSDSGPRSVGPRSAKYSEAQIMTSRDCLHPRLLEILASSHDSLESLELVDSCIPLNSKMLAEICYTYFRCFLHLGRLKVSFWNIPTIEKSPELSLLELASLQLCIAQAELRHFSPIFQASLHSIRAGKFFPALKSIKLSTRTIHQQAKSDRIEWAAFLTSLQSDWSDRSKETFYGWKKSAESRNIHEVIEGYKTGIYKWESGIKFDVTNIIAYVNKLNDGLKKV